MTREEAAERLAARATALRPWVLSQVGQDADDVIQGAILGALTRLGAGVEISDPEAYLQGCIRNKICLEIRRRRKARVMAALDPAAPACTPSPFDVAAKAELIRASLETLKPRRREVLERCYIREEDRTQVCREMRLTSTQFRLLKNRAKDQFGTAGRKLAGLPEKKAA